MPVNAIVTEGLVKIYKSRKSEVRALDGVDLVVGEGSVLGLLGPNGAGKTTAVRILATLLRPDAGRAPVAGLDVVRAAMELRSIIGLSGQYAAVDDNLTGRENLVLFGRLYQLPKAEAKRRADDLLEQFDLNEAADRVVKTYSGGMRRRLDLASALCGNPKVLFLDEPTTGLDPRGRIDMWEIIRTLVREGTTLLLTTQYLEEADELASTIAVVDHGKIIARGTSDELKSQVGGERIEVVVRDRSEIGRAVEALRRDADGDITGDESGRHAQRLGRAPAGAVGWSPHRRTQPQTDPADPGACDLRHPPIDHVRAALRLRVRRRDPTAGRRLVPRVPDAGHLHADDRLRGGHDRHRASGRPQQRDPRPVPFASDGAICGVERANVIRRRLQRRHPSRPDGVRVRRRVARAHRDRRLPRRPRVAAPLRVRDVLDRRVARHDGTDRRGGAAGRIHRALPAHIPVERFRADRDAAGLPAPDRGVESCERPDRSDASALG